MFDKWDHLFSYTAGISIAVLIAGTIAACSEGIGMVGSHDVSGIDQTIKVTTYDSAIELNRAVEDTVGYKVDGVAFWRIDAIGNVKRCDIHVVKPHSKFDYNQQETWGHELMHCIYGSYHKEGER